ncbi:hypothetical protein EBE87_05490 [Pseudoroseomonas wenyumeiae]|uniref:Glycosyltransferase RgtA/B/C/D-like domain-containing protein n=1 Tax=Teichococcus wenyumeiae TaxID=2478470 RepID=A0A3A9JMB9_9PROT|nr:hypothetical protein [Pseudoroseomonas wenyumeiae]RKK05913.1 hypothetical protein D6Z83_02115 [Pseudoroseomonas wenyumeiae]RMI25858.1 hypothetical protein EBE87_05490 [Pseudoroseomonas wenyumeiae]
MSYSLPGLPDGMAPRPAALRTGTRTSLICGGIVLAALALVLFVLLRAPMKDDIAWLLWVARQWLKGQRLYIDVVEVNPPLIIWISAIPVLIGDAIGVSAKTVAVLLFAACTLWSSWLSAKLLHGLAPAFARLPVTFAVIACVLLLMPGVEFGQREHLLTVAVLPHLAILARGLEGQRTSLRLAGGAAVGAGLGVALKPRYLLCLATVELVGWVRRGFRIRLSPVIAFGVAGLYALAILVFYPSFIDRAVPLAVTLYGGTDTSLPELMLESWRLILGVGVLAALCFTLPRESAARTVLAVLAGFAAAATIAMFLDGKNWFYHRIPASTAVVLGLLLWCAEAALTWRRSGFSGRRGAVLMLAALVPLAMQADKLGARLHDRLVLAVEPEQSTEVKLERLIKREKVRTYVAFSEWIGLGFPVVDDTGVTWASRFDSMWALRGELWRARMDGKPPAEWPMRLWVAQDFIRGCPDLVVVDRRRGAEDINYPSVLAQADAGFAEVWARYQQIATLDGLQVFKRDGEGCATSPPVENNE